MIKTYYKVVRGDLSSACYDWFTDYKEAKELYDKIKGKALWVDFSKYIVKETIFRKTTLQVICIAGYTKDEE